MIVGVLVFLAATGLLIFAPTKALGYYAAGRYLRSQYPHAAVRPVSVAVRRCLPGAGLDLLACMAVLALRFSRPTILAVFAMLMVARGLLWWTIVATSLSEDGRTGPSGLAGLVILGTLWSAVLDLVGIGLWVGAITLYERLAH